MRDSLINALADVRRGEEMLIETLQKMEREDYEIRQKEKPKLIEVAAIFTTYFVRLKTLNNLHGEELDAHFKKCTANLKEQLSRIGLAEMIDWS